jgi:Rieske Fe-S protein
MKPESPAGASPALDLLPPEIPRRGFLTRLTAVVAGGIVAFVPVAVGIATFFTPLRKSVKARQRPEGSDDEGFFSVAPLDALTSVPQAFKIVANRKDAWNTFPSEAIGAVYLQRIGTNEVRAFNASCPHAGCSVGYRADKNAYLCPCHNSAFAADGARDPKSPSPRDLDTLAVKIEAGRVLVKFENFKAGVKEKKAV